jgi:hypothetical protein
MKKKIAAYSLSALNIALIGGIALSVLSAPVLAQGTNKEPVEKPKKSVGCPSGWSSTKNSETDTSRCFPLGTLSPKIYGKKESESCASGYYEVYGVWCSTKKP